MTLDLPAAMRRSAQDIAPGLARDPQPQRERYLQRISPRLRLLVLEEMDAWLTTKIRRLEAHHDDRVPGLQTMRRWVRAQIQQGGRRL